MDLRRAVPGLGSLPDRNYGFGFVPVRFPGLLSAELPTKRAGNVEETCALFPAASTFLKLARTGVFRVFTFAFRPVPAV